MKGIELGMNTTLRKIFAPAALFGLLANPGTVGFAAPRQDTKTDAKPETKTEKSENKSQESVATKKPFGTIKADDDAITKALDAKDLDAAKKRVGKEGAFVGTVTKIYTAKNNSLIVLDFDADFRSALTAKLEPGEYDKFPKMKDLLDKKILVKGKFVLYKKQVEIELTDPAQIKIIEK